MDRNNLLIATGAGTLLQVLMVVVGHWVEPVRGMYLWGGLAISAAAGVLYAWRVHPGWAWALLGGVISGGVCAFLGILVSFLLGDVPAMILVVGTLSSAVTGVIGGAIGKLIR
ncbi:MAG: hypothetical protein JSR45_17550 [Proteobacteria bacterium]|nr:hypothetical protein [Pseudomonadota bacterium]